jgi:hypothetical protein
MRGLIPPNIAKTDMKTMLKEGVPRDIAERVWQKKVLWLICMHADDLPKVQYRHSLQLLIAVATVTTDNTVIAISSQFLAVSVDCKVVIYLLTLEFNC